MCGRTFFRILCGRILEYMSNKCMYEVPGYPAADTRVFEQNWLHAASACKCTLNLTSTSTGTTEDEPQSGKQSRVHSAQACYMNALNKMK